MKTSYILNKSILYCFSLIFLLLAQAKAQNDSSEVCISKTEYDLYTLIMEYRKAKKLPLIPLSESLTKVAQVHSRDLFTLRPDNTPCNLHSWSDQGKWSACCYYPDHRNKECMWDKPKELTNYNAPGYEIAYYHSVAVNPEEALQGWKKSPGHNMILINSHSWKQTKWNAIGIGIYKNYATVWFGSAPEDKGIVKICDK